MLRSTFHIALPFNNSLQSNNFSLDRNKKLGKQFPKYAFGAVDTSSDTLLAKFISCLGLSATKAKVNSILSRCLISTVKDNNRLIKNTLALSVDER